ncbi:MAG: DNA/RNA non-specific endonuclease [Oscillospiraceae bacterium]|nr:DNA/RNA non-specific endonuclease [Oscillospiraceae bacterium]
MRKNSVLLCLFALMLLFSACNLQNTEPQQTFPPYSGEAYCIINENQPDFTEDEMTILAYEWYSPLDRLGRCGVARACLGEELMPTEQRESISHIKPSGWVQASYDFVDGGVLYNRCHLIGFQLAGENANERNLITGTRFLNVEGMLPFENMVADYIKETGNHVLYRVTPEYTDDCLVAEGVRIEAKSVEDDGAGICFHIYAYNHQPGVLIDYKTGQSMQSYRDEIATIAVETYYILNINSKKFHSADCKQGQGVKSENRENFYGSREDALLFGYIPAGCCNP